jgi:hypothetical protein
MRPAARSCQSLEPRWDRTDRTGGGCARGQGVNDNVVMPLTRRAAIDEFACHAHERRFKIRPPDRAHALMLGRMRDANPRLER